MSRTPAAFKVIPAIALILLALVAAPCAHADVTVKATHQKSLRGEIDGFPFLLLRGTHAERGEAHGALAAKEIIATCDGMARTINLAGLIGGQKKMGWPQAIATVHRFTFPERFEQELAGMLKGIRQALPKPEDRFLTFAGKEIDLDDLKILQTGDVFELMRCSQFSVWDKLTADGQVLIGRNWDYPPLFPIDYRCLLAIEPAEKDLKPTLDAMWFGMIGSGMATLTQDGIYLSADDGGIRTGGLVFPKPSPSALVARSIIESATPADVVDQMAQGMAGKVPLCLIFHIVTPGADGKTPAAAAIEYDPRPNGNGTKIRRPDPQMPGALWLTNHCLLSDRRTQGDSADRYRKIRQAISDAVTNAKPIGFPEAKAILNAVSKSSPQMTTAYSAIVWPQQRKLMIATSPQPGVSATKGTYVTVEWDKLFGAHP